MVNKAIAGLIGYALEKKLILPEERVWAINALLEVLNLDSFREPETAPADRPLPDLLKELTDDAAARGVFEDRCGADRDRFDTALMGRLTPRPAEVIAEFRRRYGESPEAATDWYYDFSQNTNYIRRDRTARDIRWKTATAFGDLDITINLAKPEKDPRDIAAAKNSSGGYPECLLCRENEGFSGASGWPARQNHRLIPLRLGCENWYLQYSPYVYYNEHCIALSASHTPMVIDRACFRRLLDFVIQFPHYFIGSNADLPIVGGSILSHEHFQGGRYVFAMEKAETEENLTFSGFPDVGAGIVRWPLSVLRLRGADPERVAELADRIFRAWRGYSDGSVSLLAETDGVLHNTVTPIARRRDGDFELDLALRNNRTTAEHPNGLFHPHAELHHIKKENIGLIEVMGLAVLPPRLKTELAAVAEALVTGADLSARPETAPHAAWARDLAEQYSFTSENAEAILKRETGLVFLRVLEQCGVFSRDETGQAAFRRFAESV